MPKQMTLKAKNQLLIDTLVAVYPLVARGFVELHGTMSGGQKHIKDTLKKVGAMEEDPK